MIRATEANRPAITAFLRARIETSMFPLTNLSNHGMAGGHLRAMRFWIRHADGRLTDVLGLTEEGMCQPQITLDAVPACAALLRGRSLIGIVGDAAQVAALRAACGLSGAPHHLAADEPLFSLSLASMTPPAAAQVMLIPLADAPRGVIMEWLAAYDMELLGLSPDAAVASAEADWTRYTSADSHRVLMRQGTPVAMTGFNASLPDTVQIGGVYVPPPLRNQGLARQAVYCHLTEAQARGVTRAILFAANDAAARAYAALGFARVGSYNLTLFDGPQLVRDV